jgi:hypothetical protein
MTADNAAKTRCEHCKKAIDRKNVAAAAVNAEGTYAWCFTCWDTEPAAVEEYRAIPVHLTTGNEV